MEQVTGTKAPLASGQSITASVGDELIILTCVRPGYAYTVSVEMEGAIPGFGRHVLATDPYATEEDARAWARTLTIMKCEALVLTAR